MKHEIMVANYIDSGFSPEDANTIIPVVVSEVQGLSDDDYVEMNFSGVKFFTTRFFNLILTSLLKFISLEEYSYKIKMINLTEVGAVAHQHSLDSAKQNSKMNINENDIRARILEEIIQE